MRKSKKTIANNPPEKAMLGPNASVSLNFRRGRKPKPRKVDPDRDKKIAEFLARKKEGNDNDSCGGSPKLPKPRKVELSRQY
jgi:hypothetical protein